MKHITMKHIAIENCHARLGIVARSMEFWHFWNGLGAGLRNNGTALKFQLLVWNLVGWYTVLWNRSLGLLRYFLRIPRNLEFVHGKLGPGLRYYVTALTFEGFQLSALNLVGWCTVPWIMSLYKMVMLCQFWHIPRNIKMFHYMPSPAR